MKDDFKRVGPVSEYVEIYLDKNVAVEVNGVKLSTFQKLTVMVEFHLLEVATLSAY